MTDRSPYNLPLIHDEADASLPGALAGETAPDVLPRGGRKAGLIAAAVAAGVVACASVGWAVVASAAPSSSTGYGYGYSNGQQAKSHSPHLEGTVQSVSGSTILITDRDGFTRTIKVSGATTYSDNLTSSPAVGTAISAEGTVDADGTSLDATKVGAGHTGGAAGGAPGGGKAGANGGQRPGGSPESTPAK
jgi:hypothetical protein